MHKAIILTPADLNRIKNTVKGIIKNKKVIKARSLAVALHIYTYTLNLFVLKFISVSLSSGIDRQC